MTSRFGDTSAERVRQAEEILVANGEWPPQPGRAYAIQIDTDPPPASASPEQRSDYYDNYTGQVCVFRVEDGRLVEQTDSPLESASHPGQERTDSTQTPDVGGDSDRDIAHIRPGVYHYRSRPRDVTLDSGAVQERYDPLSDDEFSVARDTNQDGVISGDEAQGQYSVDAIQIHPGGSSGPTSIGCQTMPPDDYETFQNILEDANTSDNNTFTYILVRHPHEEFGPNPY